MQGDPKGIKPDYHGSSSFISWDTGRQVLPYSEPNIDFELQRMKEWSTRVESLKVDRDVADVLDLPPSVVRARQGLVNRAEDVLRKIF